VSEYTVEKLAGELELDSSQVYRWVRGDTRLPAQKAIAISEIARSAGTNLTLEDLYETDIVRVRCRMRSRSSLPPL
jgi:DNA-binding transcriptional regulator YdaS (Cro superfamily)